MCCCRGVVSDSAAPRLGAGWKPSGARVRARYRSSVQGADDDSQDAQDDRAAQRKARAARAEAAVHAIAAGADPAAEALNVSNRFTDELTSKAWSLFRRRKRRDGGVAPE